MLQLRDPALSDTELLAAAARFRSPATSMAR